MPDARSIVRSTRSHFSILQVASYVFDWIVLIVVAIGAGVFSIITPNKRPFSLYDPDISFPYTEKETVPTWLLVVLIAIFPLVVIAIVSLLFVPGTTVPKNTPASLVWKRKLWELHVGWMGLALAVIASFFFTQGMKNMFGKPRPDLLARCLPDFQNREQYHIGGFATEPGIGQLFSADICQQTDKSKLDDGFRSYPSGHSSAAAAGLIYLSLFLASKFAVTTPFVVDSSIPRGNDAVYAAFPSRVARGSIAGAPRGNADHATDVNSLRRQAAAPPVYLLVIVLVPFCLSIFIAASRWFDFRHHGFDILFGYLIGLLTSIYSFRYYHLPIQEGAGWAWGPRSHDRAFWAGVGRLGYVGDKRDFRDRVEKDGAVDYHHADGYGAEDIPAQRVALQDPAGTYGAGGRDVEMQRMGLAH